MASRLWRSRMWPETRHDARQTQSGLVWGLSGQQGLRCVQMAGSVMGSQVSGTSCPVLLLCATTAGAEQTGCNKSGLLVPVCPVPMQHALRKKRRGALNFARPRCAIHISSVQVLESRTYHAPTRQPQQDPDSTKRKRHVMFFRQPFRRYRTTCGRPGPVHDGISNDSNL